MNYANIRNIYMGNALTSPSAISKLSSAPLPPVSPSETITVPLPPVPPSGPVIPNAAASVPVVVGDGHVNGGTVKAGGLQAGIYL